MDEQTAPHDRTLDRAPSSADGSKDPALSVDRLSKRFGDRRLRGPAGSRRPRLADHLAAVRPGTAHHGDPGMIVGVARGVRPPRVGSAGAWAARAWAPGRSPQRAPP